MFFGDRDKDTICAVSTPPGIGGISVIRVSGPLTFSAVQSLCRFVPEKPESHRVYYGILKNPGEQTEIDEVVVTWFAAGQSFTGETVAEISCHGNPLICQEILKLLVDRGVRAAERGEFTYRAFMQGRLDLVQAESVLSLIESRSSGAARLALRQLKGRLSERLEKIESELTWVLAHIEAGIDFSTEGLQVADPNILSSRLRAVSNELDLLLETYQKGRLLKDGLRVVLAGRPNVGKSSLLNLLTEEDRAIVTDIAGTTRDVVEGEVLSDGQRIVFQDTAGLRDSQDPVEKIGVEKSRRAIEECDLVFFIFDSSVGLTGEDLAIWQSLPQDKVVVFGNKSDLAGKNYKDSSLAGALGEKPVSFISTLDKNTRRLILTDLKERFKSELAATDVLLSSARHYENLRAGLTNVREAEARLLEGTGEEFLALDLKEALMRIQETLGKRFDDQIMDRVFKEFCIGK